MNGLQRAMILAKNRRKAAKIRADCKHEMREIAPAPNGQRWEECMKCGVMGMIE